MTPPASRIDQMAPWLGEEEQRAVAAYLQAGGWLTEFRKTAELERMIAEYVGSRHAIIVSNGTVSLTIAAMALGIGAGDEVIVPDFTMLASATGVMLAGAKPVFVDVDPETWCVDLDRVKEAVTTRTRALMLVSINGRSPDMPRAVELCRQLGIHLIEDAAQSLGSAHQGKHLGTWGQVGSFSFSAPKIITTGQGGALVTDDDALARSIRQIKDFGRRRAGEDVYETVGFNFKFTDLQAVIGIEQVKKLPWRVDRKKAMFRLYHERLRDIPKVRVPATNLEDVAPWFMDILADDRDGLQRHLDAQGIGSRAVYPPLHSQRAFGWPGAYPHAESIGAHGLWLPSSSFLTDDDIVRITDGIGQFYA